MLVTCDRIEAAAHELLGPHRDGHVVGIRVPFILLLLFLLLLPLLPFLLYLIRLFTISPSEQAKNFYNFSVKGTVSRAGLGF
jgi:hypothetical protein